MVRRTLLAMALAVSAIVGVAGAPAQADPLVTRTSTTLILSCFSTNADGDFVSFRVVQFISGLTGPGPAFGYLSFYPADGGHALQESEDVVEGFVLTDSTVTARWSLIDAETFENAGTATLDATITSISTTHRDWFERTNSWFKVSEDDEELQVDGVLDVASRASFDVSCHLFRIQREIWKTNPAADVVHTDVTEATCVVPTALGLLFVGGFHDTTWHAETWTTGVAVLDDNLDYVFAGGSLAVPFKWQGQRVRFAGEAPGYNGTASFDYTLRLTGEQTRVRTGASTEFDIVTVQPVSISGSVSVSIGSDLLTVPLDATECFAQRQQTFNHAVYL